ncbi:MAG: glycosyltransferase family 2 protein [Candidatus Daviesbacteria bacterium]|nr:MAG: glycosyltransferase family 2 protein [Candidatus Daviesbacteria bacterium]
MKKLSVVLATFNEEKNLPACLNSIKEITDEIVIVDGSSADKTVEIARSFGAKVLIKDNPPIFHINKQKALDLAQNEWILQLDADERVSKALAQEIRKVIEMTNEEVEIYQRDLKNRRLFLRHQKLLEERDGRIGDSSKEYAAFFIPRLNYFLGKYLRYGGVYPDGVIRLVRKNKAYFPCLDVHEQITVDGKVGWLQNDLYHMADPTFERYLKRNSRYINLIADDLEKTKVGKNIWQLINFYFIKSSWWFLLTLFRHKGILDGFQGLIFSFFSALRFPRAYFRYLTGKRL